MDEEIRGSNPDDGDGSSPVQLGRRKGKTCARPKILGIASAFYSTRLLPAARRFLRPLILHEGDSCSWRCKQNRFNATRYFPATPGESIAFAPTNGTPPRDLLIEVVLATDNVKAMKKYLTDNKIIIEKPPA